MTNQTKRVVLRRCLWVKNNQWSYFIYSGAGDGGFGMGNYPSKKKCLEAATRGAPADLPIFIKEEDWDHKNDKVIEGKEVPYDQY